MKDLAWLGHKVKDNITGFTGIVEGVVVNQFTANQAYVTEQKPTGDGRNTWVIDLCSLKKLSKKPLIPVVPAQSIEIAFGDKVSDNVTGISGSVIATVIHINGCVNHQITTLDKKKYEQRSFNIEQARLKIVSRAKKPKNKKEKPGGLAYKLQR